MSFEWFIARRYLTARRRQAFISLISGVSIVGVGVGVMAVIIALALMTGVQGELRDRIVGSRRTSTSTRSAQPFLDVDAELERLMVPGVAGGAPAIRGLGLLTSSRSPGATPVELKGIDPARRDERDRHWIGGRQGQHRRARQPRPRMRWTASSSVTTLAEDLGVTVGDSVTLITPQAVVMPTYRTPRIRVFQVVGHRAVRLLSDRHGGAFIALETAATCSGRTAPT